MLDPLRVKLISESASGLVSALISGRVAWHALHATKCYVFRHGSSGGDSSG